MQRHLVRVLEAVMADVEVLQQMRQQVALQLAQLDRLIAESSPVPEPPCMDAACEMSDDDLFWILHNKGLAEYKVYLRRRNKQRLARMKKFGHM